MTALWLRYASCRHLATGAHVGILSPVLDIRALWHPFVTFTLRGVSGSGGRMRTGAGGVSAPRGRSHRKYLNKSPLTSSCNAKKLAVFLPEFRLLEGRKSGNICQYKLGLLIVQF